jgi:hypothetical protein
LFSVSLNSYYTTMTKHQGTMKIHVTKVWSYPQAHTWLWVVLEKNISSPLKLHAQPPSSLLSSFLYSSSSFLVLLTRSHRERMRVRSRERETKRSRERERESQTRERRPVTQTEQIVRPGSPW